MDLWAISVKTRRIARPPVPSSGICGERKIGYSEETPPIPASSRRFEETFMQITEDMRVDPNASFQSPKTNWVVWSVRETVT